MIANRNAESHLISEEREHFTCRGEPAIFVFRVVLGVILEEGRERTPLVAFSICYIF